jgi:hypothetical protein
MFTITGGKGFRMKFDNGWTVSVQWGPGSYSGRRDWIGDYEAPRRSDTWESPDAEVAAWKKDEPWYNFGDDTVKGYMNVNEVLEFINMIKSKEE